jgi:hypothetical protein
VARRRWWLVLAASAALALVSVASDLTTATQLSGEADVQSAVRSTLSKLANAGAVWGGLPVLSGWLVRGRGHAVAAGAVACLTALVVHYGVGRLLGQFGATVWAENASWFALAVVVGPALGLVGAAARRSDRWGLLGSLVVPVGAVLEPFYVGMFTMPATMPWPGRVSSAVSGVALLVAGTAGAVAVLVRRRRGPRTP